jgi:hypothetical protein
MTRRSYGGPVLQGRYRTTSQGAVQPLAQLDQPLPDWGFLAVSGDTPHCHRTVRNPPHQDEKGARLAGPRRQGGTAGARSRCRLASNYGEAGALELFGRGLPPVASAHVTFRYWRPPVAG